jgi:hypothetical protein
MTEEDETEDHEEASEMEVFEVAQREVLRVDGREVTEEALVETTDQRLCTQLLAQVVESHVKFLSDQLVRSLFTVEIVLQDEQLLVVRDQIEEMRDQIVDLSQTVRLLIQTQVQSLILHQITMN